ncbi:hypothetical protein SAMN05216338_1014130 [Bradyrhizobium sp. Rc2d]|uniref:hypothetical protein n=1 Tax=Bradyrhizobium sp. Rc2d TaxID=1855321 RepID=UPI00088422FD|nr:hypothetical protein [Bradyrhizobium sp. Rc2d]SDH88701.1 hypothetical protein SAMN05216338_1014130 [Bradyrhizobium sp. Rc2d]
MEATIEIVLHAGRSAVDVALYTLLPIIVLMTIAMRFLEVSGVLTGSGSSSANKERGQTFHRNEIAKTQSALARICIVHVT